MVIRDLTLRSAASFGSFHLIRLLYDEYMFYLVEHRVAQATGETPIGVMGEVRTRTSPAFTPAQQVPSVKQRSLFRSFETTLFMKRTFFLFAENLLLVCREML